jgi:hypothetical protein
MSWFNVPSAPDIDDPDYDPRNPYGDNDPEYDPYREDEEQRRQEAQLYYADLAEQRRKEMFMTRPRKGALTKRPVGVSKLPG